MKLLRFPSERARPPGVKHNKKPATIRLFPNLHTFKLLMTSLGWKLKPQNLQLTAPPKFPALPYYPQG